MKFTFVRTAIVVAVTALSVWFIPALADGVEFMFQIAVLVVS